MERSYWEKIAPDYDVEIFDVLLNDEKCIIQKAILEFANKNKSVLDIGCAIGKWLPLLSPIFKTVLAIDISKENLQIAKSAYPKLKNVDYARVDMSNNRSKIKACDFAICINALLTASQKKRTTFFKNISKSVKKGGQLLLVVPSLESSLFTSIIRQRWNPDKDADKLIVTNKINSQFKNILQGNVEIDKLPTKHYLKEELFLLLQHEGFEVSKIEKIEYSWDTEFSKPPHWLNNPKPWDWMLVANKL